MSEAIADAVNDYEQLRPRQVTIHEWRVLSWRNDSLTAHKVNLLDLTCTCEDEAYNTEGNQICDHLATALNEARKDMDVGDALKFDMTGKLQQLDQAVRSIERRATGIKADAEAETVPAQMEEQTRQQRKETGADVEDRIDDVEDWIQNGIGQPEHVDIREGQHGNNFGIVLEPDNQAMSDGSYEAFKGIVNGLEGSEAHVGFGDDPCHSCGESDGEFFYFIPSHKLSEVPGV